MIKKKKLLKFLHHFAESEEMKELILCLVEQDLNEIPWAITLIEYLRLKEIAKEDGN